MYKVYLDQNFISDIAKIDHSIKGSKIKSEIKLLYKLIVKAVANDKIVIPFSPIHYQESFRKNNPEFHKLIFEKFKDISKIRFRRSENIREQLFIYYALKYFDKKFINLDDIYIDKNDNNFQEFWFSSFENQYVMIEDIVEKMIESPKLLQDIRKSDVNNHKQYTQEINMHRKNYQEFAIRKKFLFERYDLTVKQIYEFINSLEFQNISSIDIFCKLWNADLSNTYRQSEKGDENDIEMLSVYAPYCDIVATDNNKKALMQSLKLDINYNIEIFSMKNIKELLTKIRNISN